jgi:hypothetical protein
MRYRVMNNKFSVWPVPSLATSATNDPPEFAPYQIAMEYVISNWVIKAATPDVPTAEMVTEDGDICMYNPWLLIKFTKVKFYQLKQFDASGVQADFMLMFNSLTGKDVGAGVLSLSPGYPPQFLGVWNIPDGSWNTGAP